MALQSLRLYQMHGPESAEHMPIGDLGAAQLAVVLGDAHCQSSAVEDSNSIYTCRAGQIWIRHSACIKPNHKRLKTQDISVLQNLS